MARLGEIIDGKYEVLREIGKGGMSVVYLAMDKRLNKQWAIKEFRKDKDDASKQVALKALLDEANLMKKLDHPTLPRIVDIIETNNTVYIVMDYIEGESLNKVLDAYGAQPQEAVIEWAKQLSGVLDYLHTQNPPVIYRDMKPANIMLKPDGTVRLIDFGIAREYKEGKEGDTEAIGTRGYAAPEQFGGRGQTDARTDIYSLGVTLYHLVTGKNPAEPPYEIYPIRHWDPTLSSGLEWLIQKCTQLNPNDRYQSCAEVTYVLENLDKFEGAYQKQLRGRVTLFMVFAILAVTFGITSVGLFAGHRTVKENNYEAYIALDTAKGYELALEIDSERSDAYIGLVKYLRNHIDAIYKDNPGEGNLGDNEITSSQLMKWFDTDDMSLLRQNDPETYATVYYELGRLYWNCCKKNANEPDYVAGINGAREHFEKVMLVTYEEGDSIIESLGEKKYNMAKTYYLVSYFQSQKEELLGVDDGEIELGNAQIQAGIMVSESGTLEDPYYTFWMSIKEMLQVITEDDDMSDIVRMEAIKRASYILNENYSDFRKKTSGETAIEGDDMVEMFEALQLAMDQVDRTEEMKEEIAATCNEINNAIKFIEADYKVKIEEVK